MANTDFLGHILSMENLLELNRKIGAFMGWKDIEEVTDGPTGQRYLVGVSPETMYGKNGWAPKYKMPDFPHDIKAAWAAAEKCNLFAMNVLGRNGTKWQVLDPCFYAFGDSDVIAESEVAATAICLAVEKQINAQSASDQVAAAPQSQV